MKGLTHGKIPDALLGNPTDPGHARMHLVHLGRSLYDWGTPAKCRKRHVELAGRLAVCLGPGGEWRDSIELWGTIRLKHLHLVHGWFRWRWVDVDACGPTPEAIGRIDYVNGKRRSVFLRLRGGATPFIRGRLELGSGCTGDLERWGRIELEGSNDGGCVLDSDGLPCDPLRAFWHDDTDRALSVRRKLLAK